MKQIRIKKIYIFLYFICINDSTEVTYSNSCKKELKIVMLWQKRNCESNNKTKNLRVFEKKKEVTIL